MQDVNAADVNAYLRDVTGREFTAKDFRTWAGTVLTAVALKEFDIFETPAQAKGNILRAIQRVAERLGNTPTICRKCYIHPEVINAYLDGSLVATLPRRARKKMTRSIHALKLEESALLALLKHRIGSDPSVPHRKARGGKAPAQDRTSRPRPARSHASQR